MNFKISVAAVCLLSATACDTMHQNVTPELRTEMLQNLRTGNVDMTCTVTCVYSWVKNVHHFQALDISENWPDLAIGVMQIGERSDLAYYYLGQSAQGMGYHEAAIKLYRKSAGIAAGDWQGQVGLQCAANDTCQGVDLPSVLPQLIQASMDALNTQKAQSPPPRRKAKAPAAPAGPADPGWVLPNQ